MTSVDIERISQRVGGEVRLIILSNITAKGYFDIFHLLRTIKAEHLYFPIIDSSNQSMAPVFKVLGMISSSRMNYFVMPDLSLTLLGPGSGTRGCLSLIYGILICSMSMLKDFYVTSKLLTSPRIRIPKKLSWRILYLKHTLWLGLQAGGSIAHARGVVKGFLSGGREVDLLSLDSHLPISSREGLRVINSISSFPYIVPRELNFAHINRNSLDSLMSKPFGSCGVIYQRLSPGNFSGVIISRFRKIPLIIEYNGSETWLAKNWGSGWGLSRFVEKVEHLCLKHAHLVVTVSDVLKNELIELGIEPERIVSYPNGVDPDEFNPERFSHAEIKKVRDELEIPENGILLTFVGTFGHWHGADFLATVMSEQANDNPEWYEENNIFVCFVGDGVKRHDVDMMLVDCALADRFKLTGMVSQEETPLYMAASDILLSPHVPNPDGSPFFGSPTKLFEYMASARPVIASDLFQIGEVLEGAARTNRLPPSGSLPTQKQCGVLVKPKSAKEIIQAIDFLVENPKWRRAAGKNARKRVLSKYTWKRHVEEINRGLDKMLLTQELATKQTTTVLINALHAKTGGGVTYLKNVLPLMSENPDFELHLCIHESQLNILPKLNSGVQLHTFSFESGFWNLPFREQIDVPKLARKIGADVTFSPANYGPLFAPNPVIMLRNALGVAFVERRPIKIAYWMLVSIGTFLSMLTCRRVIAVSKYAHKSNFGAITGFLRNRFSIVPHGVSRAFCQKPNGLKRKDFILAVSDIYVQKNLKNLLYAIDILRSKKPDIKLKIAGRFVDENYHQELNKLISTKRLENNIEFLGGVDEADLVDLYKNCAVFVFPSTVETFGNPLIEAMASGAPIAASNTAAMPEIAGDAALYFDPHNIEEMASSIGRLLSDQALCDDLSHKATVRSKDYSWEKTVENTLDILYQAAPGVTE